MRPLARPLAAIVVMLVCAWPVAAAQGGRQAQRQGVGPDEGVSPAEIQRMFDSYALLQAQDQLKISEAQFPQFLTRFKALQDLRRQALVERTRRVNELRRQLNSAQPDEAAMSEQLKGLQDLETRSHGDIRKAYDAIDQVLDLRQQAKFRVFEEMMERRKLELVNRARQANRPKL